MLSSRITFLATITILGLLLLAAIYQAPLTKEYRLLAPTDQTSASFLLLPKHTVKQTFSAHGNKQSGVRIYTASPALTDQALLIEITDSDNKLLATGRLTGTSYQNYNDSLILDYAFPWITTPPDQPLTLRLSLTSGTHLPIHISKQNTYPGNLFIDEEKQAGDLALATIHPQPLTGSARTGAIIGVFLFIAIAFVLSFIPLRYQWLAAAILLIVVTPLSLLGFWFSSGDLGIADWDLYFSYHEIVRRTVLDWQTFPFWNPWLCGGTAGLGDPEFPLFTLTFLLEFIFGIRTGFPLAIYLSLSTTAVGLLLLAKRLRLSLPASLLAALAGTFGGVTIIEIVEGHPNVFAAMWIPWIFWAWLAAYRNYQSPPSHNKPSFTAPAQNNGSSSLFKPWFTSRLNRASIFPPNFNLWTLWCGVFLALTFYAGGIYLLMYTVLAFIFLVFLTRHPLVALRTIVISGLWGLGLAALKLLPVLFWLSNFQDKNYAGSAFTLPHLTQILFGRHLHGSNIVFAQNSGWHEYGAYIGYFVFGLALIGLSRLKKQRLIRALFIASVAAILLSAVGPALQPYFDQLPFLPRSNISRFILFGIIPLSLLAGFGLDTLLTTTLAVTPKQKTSGSPTFQSSSFIQHSTTDFLSQPISLAQLLRLTLILLIIGFVAIDLFSFVSQLSTQAFVLPDVVNPPPAAPYPLAYTAQRFDQSGDSSRTTRSYAAIRQGYGTLTYCSVLGPDPMVRTIHDEVDNGIVLARPEPDSIELIDWNPNRAQFNLSSSTPTKVILNTNFAPGWQAQSITNNNVVSLPVTNDSGRVTTTAPAGQQIVSFEYHAAGFIPGIIITLSTLTLGVYTTYSKAKRSAV